MKMARGAGRKNGVGRVPGQGECEQDTSMDGVDSVDYKWMVLDNVGCQMVLDSVGCWMVPDGFRMVPDGAGR